MNDAEIKARAREARIAVCNVTSPKRIAAFRSGSKDSSSTGIQTAIRALRDINKPLPKDDPYADWRKAHDEFCLAAGYCFTPGQNDCATLSRIAGLKAALKLMPKDTA